MPVSIVAIAASAACAKEPEKPAPEPKPEPATPTPSTPTPSTPTPSTPTPSTPTPSTPTEPTTPAPTNPTTPGTDNGGTTNAQPGNGEGTSAEKDQEKSIKLLEIVSLDNLKAELEFSRKRNYSTIRLRKLDDSGVLKSGGKSPKELVRLKEGTDLTKVGFSRQENNDPTRAYDYLDATILEDGNLEVSFTYDGKNVTQVIKLDGTEENSSTTQDEPKDAPVAAVPSTSTTVREDITKLSLYKEMYTKEVYDKFFADLKAKKDTFVNKDYTEEQFSADVSLLEKYYSQVLKLKEVLKANSDDTKVLEYVDSQRTVDNVIYSYLEGVSKIKVLEINSLAKKLSQENNDKVNEKESAPDTDNQETGDATATGGEATDNSQDGGSGSAATSDSSGAGTSTTGAQPGTDDSAGQPANTESTEKPSSPAENNDSETSNNASENDASSTGFTTGNSNTPTGDSSTGTVDGTSTENVEGNSSPTTSPSNSDSVDTSNSSESSNTTTSPSSTESTEAEASPRTATPPAEETPNPAASTAPTEATTSEASDQYPKETEKYKVITTRNLEELNAYLDTKPKKNNIKFMQYYGRLSDENLKGFGFPGYTDGAVNKIIVLKTEYFNTIQLVNDKGVHSGSGISKDKYIKALYNRENGILTLEVLKTDNTTETLTIKLV